MTTETIITPQTLLQSIDTDPAESVTADLEVAICFIETCEGLVSNIRGIIKAFGHSPELFRDIKNLDIILFEAKDKIVTARENAGRTVDAIFDAKRAERA